MCILLVYNLIFLSGLHFRLHDWKYSKFVFKFLIVYEHRQVKSKRSPSTTVYI